MEKFEAAGNSLGNEELWCSLCWKSRVRWESADRGDVDIRSSAWALRQLEERAVGAYK